VLTDIAATDEQFDIWENLSDLQDVMIGETIIGETTIGERLSENDYRRTTIGERLLTACRYAPQSTGEANHFLPDQIARPKHVCCIGPRIGGQYFIVVPGWPL